MGGLTVLLMATSGLQILSATMLSAFDKVTLVPSTWNFMLLRMWGSTTRLPLHSQTLIPTLVGGRCSCPRSVSCSMTGTHKSLLLWQALLADRYPHWPPISLGSTALRLRKRGGVMRIWAAISTHGSTRRLTHVLLKVEA